MIIGGWQKFSTLDYPYKLSAIVFTQGCNFRCHFCYNPMLVLPSSETHNVKSHPLIPEDDFFDFLRSRQGKLDAVVITGGEPTLHADLPEFIAKIKALGFLVKLDTNGTNPERLRQILSQGQVDYLAMDLKASPEKYAQVVGVSVDFSKIQESVKIIMQSALPYEFRTTVVPGLVSITDIPAMAQAIAGAELWYLQEFQSDHDLVNSQLQGSRSYTRLELEQMAQVGQEQVKACRVR